MISRVGNLALNDMVICGGEVCKVTGFATRSTVLLENMDKQSGRWSTAKVSIKDVKKPGFVAEILAECDVTIRHLVADAIEKGLREKCIACKTDVVGDEVHVTVAAHRPAPFIKMKLMLPEEVVG